MRWLQWRKQLCETGKMLRFIYFSRVYLPCNCVTPVYYRTTVVLNSPIFVQLNQYCICLHWHNHSPPTSIQRRYTNIIVTCRRLLITLASFHPFNVCAHPADTHTHTNSERVYFGLAIVAANSMFASAFVRLCLNWRVCLCVYVFHRIRSFRTSAYFMVANSTGSRLYAYTLNTRVFGRLSCARPVRQSQTTTHQCVFRNFNLSRVYMFVCVCSDKVG